MESSFLNPTTALESLELHAGLRVADLAAGAGFFARAAARLVAPGEVWAVDPNPELLARLKNLALTEGLRNIEVVRGDIERHGGSQLPDAAFDAALVVNALFTARRKEAVAQEANRVLKRGGALLVVDWSESHGGLGPHPDHVVTESAAKEIFEQAGFAAVGRAAAGGYHWGVILRKK